MSTTTSNYSLTKPAVNNATDEDLWGSMLNTNMDLIDTQMKASADLITEIETDLGEKANITGNTFTGAQLVTATVITSSSNSIATDFSANNNFTHTLTENTTLANPSNIVAGQSGSIQFTNHASSPKTLAYGTYFKFPGGTVPTLTASNSACDTLFYNVRSATFIEANLVKGFA